MTDEEVEGLKPGEHVEVKVGQKWVAAVVLAGRLWRRDVPLVVARRLDNYPDGSGYKRLLREPGRRVRRVNGFSPLPANVYADFLEERGEEKAASLLRKAFPLDDGTG